MEFGPTFGAVGDFISITVLIKDIITALDDARGSATRYQELTNELNTLRQTLDAVQETYESPQLTHSQEDVSGIALGIVAQTKNRLNGFLQQIRKYEPSLGTGAGKASSSLKIIGRKIQWKFNEKEVDKFRAEVMGCTMALKVLLEVITLRALQRNYESLAIEQSAAENRTAALIRQSEASLKASLGSMCQDVVSRLRIVHRLGIELKNSASNIFSMMHTIVGEMSGIKSIIMRLETGPGDEHFVLEDVTGRAFPIHLKTVTSWEVFEFILNERFKGQKGARRVQRKLYSLRENNTHQEIDESMPWESAFMPHQKVNMSLMCKAMGDKSQDGQVTSSCPFCKTPSVRDTGVEVKCRTCGRFFTRVIDLDDDEPHHPSRSSANTKRARSDQEEQAWDIRHQRIYRRADIGPGRRRVLSSESDSDDEDVRGLMRVHLVSQRAQSAQQKVNSAGPGQSSNHSTNSPCSNVSLASDDLSTPMGGKTHWPCGKCSKICRTRSELRKHQLNHTHPWRCHVCSRDNDFTSRSNLDRHNRMMHNYNINFGRNFICNIGDCANKPAVKDWSRADIFRAHLAMKHFITASVDEDLSKYCYDDTPQPQQISVDLQNLSWVTKDGSPPERMNR